MSRKTVFDFAAQVGLTKHLGGMEATEEMAAQCHIDEGKLVLDVGCGVGVTACYLAKRYGARVVGIDILPGMIESSIARAQREHVADRVTFEVGDVQELAFDDDHFDAVITESVMVFPTEKQRAADECARVTRDGGYVGLNEFTWLKTPPPPEVVAWMAQDLGGGADALTAGGWRQLLENAGLRVVHARTAGVDVGNELKGLKARYGLVGMLGIFARMFALYLRDPDYRAFAQEVKGGSGPIPKEIHEYSGYGVYVGQK
jgi:SAM-dependent methyltransferase